MSGGGAGHAAGLDPAGYPFGRAEGSFFLGDGEALTPAQAAAPLLAYGANASPEVLERKLGPDANAAGLAAQLHGWAVVHSAHVSPYGAVPATIVPREGAVADVHVLLVEDPAPLDGTELNYERVELSDLRLEVDRIGPLEAVEAYVSVHGPLLIGGEPVALGARTLQELLAAVP